MKRGEQIKKDGPGGGAGVLEHPAGAGEDDDADARVAEHGELVGLLEQPAPALGEGHLPVRGVLDPLDLDLPATHLRNRNDRCKQEPSYGFARLRPAPWSLSRLLQQQQEQRGLIVFTSWRSLMH